MSLDRKELGRIVSLAEAAGWRVQPTQGAAARHVLMFPPDGGRPVGFSMTERGDRRGRSNVFAALRRAGLEVDPRRMTNGEQA